MAARFDGRDSAIVDERRLGRLFSAFTAFPRNAKTRNGQFPRLEDTIATTAAFMWIAACPKPK
jgi:hypothetical protein